MNLRNNHGFTLLELAIVLGIIALLTHLAVREAGQWRAAHLHAHSTRTLDEIRQAISAGTFAAYPAQPEMYSDFLADMGRLPRAITNAQGQATLAELWAPPAAEHYAVRAAAADNMVTNMQAEADDEVLVGCGWRGPYLRLPQGKTVLTDGWGNPFETPDTAGYARLLNVASNAVQQGETIALIRHLGADGQPDRIAPRWLVPDMETTETAEATTARRRRRRALAAEDQDGILDLHALPGGLAALTNATLSVAVTAYNADGSAYNGAGLPVTVRVYSPSDGKISVRKAGGTLNGAIFNARIDGLTPGRRVLRVECNGRKSAPRTIQVQAGQRSDLIVEKIVIADGNE